MADRGQQIQELKKQFGLTETQAGRIGQDERIQQQLTDIALGQRIGKTFIKPGELGRLGTDESIQDIESRIRALSEGFTPQEIAARREEGIEQIAGSTQAARRRLQAALARAGVRGGAAGAQLRDVELGGLAERARFERGLQTDILGEQRAAQERSVRGLAEFTTGVREFDLAQAAAEKNIELQTALAQAQLGSAERGASRQAVAIQQSSAAQASAACFSAGTLIEMEDGSEKDIAKIIVGDILANGS